MSASDSVRAGKAYVEVGANNDSLVRDLAKSSRILKSWGGIAASMGKQLMAAGSGITAPLMIATKIYASLGAELARGAVRAGVSVEAFSVLKYAAEQSGVSVETMERSLGKLSRTLVEAAHGSPEAMNAFRRLGLSISDIAKMTPEQKLGAIGDALAKIKSPDLQRSLVEQIFGRGGLELLPLLAQGSAGMSEFGASAKELGLIVSDEAAAAALDFEKKMSALWSVTQMVAFQIGGALVPVLRPLVVGLANSAKLTADFIREHQGLVVAVAATGAGLLVTGAAVYVFAQGLEAVGTIMGAIVTTVGVAGTLFAALTSPLGLVAIGAGAAVIALLKFTNVGTVVGSFLGKVFNALEDDALEALGGIRDAFAAGDWSLAAQILWAYVKLEFAKGIAEVSSLYSGGNPPPNYGGMIGVDQDGNVAGTDIDVTTFDFTLTFYVNPIALQSTYVRQLVDLRGAVNQDTFTINVDGLVLTFYPGEVRFMHSTGGKRQWFGDWELSLHFSALPNLSNINVGQAVQGISKNGWDYLWVEYAQSLDNSAKRRVPQVLAVHTERVFAYKSLSSLLIQSSFSLSNKQPWMSLQTFNGAGLINSG